MRQTTRWVMPPSLLEPYLYYEENGETLHIYWGSFMALHDIERVNEQLHRLHMETQLEGLFHRYHGLFPEESDLDLIAECWLHCPKPLAWRVVRTIEGYFQLAMLSLALTSAKRGSWSSLGS